MGGPRIPWHELTDEELLDLRHFHGTYEGVAAALRERWNRYLSHVAVFDEVIKRGLKGEWNSIKPMSQGEPERKTVEALASDLRQFAPPKLLRGNSEVVFPLSDSAETPQEPIEPKFPSLADRLEEDNKRLQSELKRYQKRDRLELRLADVIQDEVRGSLRATNPLLSYSPRPRGNPSSEHSFTLLLSDAHYSEKVQYSETAGLEDYTTAIHDERMLRVFDALCSFQENRPYQVSHINVFMLGDMLSGNIHDELSITNEMPQTKAIVQYGKYMSDWLEMLTSRFDSIRVCGISGNHPRFSKQPFNKQGYDTGDWLAYKYIEAALENNPRFEFDIPEANIHDILLDGGWRFLMLHGQGIKSMGSSPENAVARRVKDLQLQFSHAGKPIDYMVLGHWHRASQLSGVGIKTYINGSIKGIDEYGLTRFGSGQDPEQLLLTTHPDWGVTDVSYINLTPRVPNRKKVMA